MAPTVRKLLTVLLSAALWALPAHAQDDAFSDVFERLSPALFVVESVEKVSRSKNSVGSGFAVADGALIATNYHVVSSAYLKPTQYELRALDRENRDVALEIVAVDVIHDLALLRAAGSDGGEAGWAAAVALPFAGREPAMGEAIAALGNPLDIGLSVVPGTYNGLLRRSYRGNIHFTGALNPGMSGGPAVNARGEVVGVNVAGAGNSVGFLVPARHLAALVDYAPEIPDHGPGEEFRARILAHQGALIDDLLAGDWTLQEFGPLLIPKEVRDYVNCSGAAREQEADTRWTMSASNCTVDDRIFVSRHLQTGPVEMYFGLLETDDLSAFQFARAFSSGRFYPANRGRDEDLSDFECLDRWTTLPNLGEQPFKATYCLRSYLGYAGVYDVLYVARALFDDARGVQIHYTLAGVGRDAAERFHVKFTEALQWK